jgi:ribosomal protein S18 acetylase RimI-like enzyme
MEVRLAKIKDVLEIVPLLYEVAIMHIEKRPDIFKEKELKIMTNYAEELIKDKNNIILVAEENKKIKGVIVCKIKEVKNHVNIKDSKSLWIDELCVKSESQKKGIGKLLMQKAKDIARKEGCIRLELNCWEFNENAIKFYEKQELTTQRRIMEVKI